MDGDIKGVRSERVVSASASPESEQLMAVNGGLENGTIPRQHSQPVSTSEGIVSKKAFIAKAKAIIQSTKSDPYVRAVEITKLRAEYAQDHSSKVL